MNRARLYLCIGQYALRQLCCCNCTNADGRSMTGKLLTTLCKLVYGAELK